MQKSVDEEENVGQEGGHGDERDGSDGEEEQEQEQEEEEDLLMNTSHTGMDESMNSALNHSSMSEGTMQFEDASNAISAMLDAAEASVTGIMPTPDRENANAAADRALKIADDKRAARAAAVLGGERQSGATKGAEVPQREEGEAEVSAAGNMLSPGRERANAAADRALLRADAKRALRAAAVLDEGSRKQTAIVAPLRTVGSEVRNRTMATGVNDSKFDSPRSPHQEKDDLLFNDDEDHGTHAEMSMISNLSMESSFTMSSAIAAASAEEDTQAKERRPVRGLEFGDLESSIMSKVRSPQVFVLFVVHLFGLFPGSLFFSIFLWLVIENSPLNLFFDLVQHQELLAMGLF